MKDLSPQEIEMRQMEFFKDMMIIDSKFIDIARDDWGLDPNDETATFGDDLEKRWDHFIRNHIVKNEGKTRFYTKTKLGGTDLSQISAPTLTDLNLSLKTSIAFTLKNT